MVKLYLKSIVFLTILFFFICKLDKFFVEDDPIYSKYNTFYEKERNTLDVLFLGDSHTANGINTSVISSKCKLDSYNLGVRGTNIFHAYFRLKEALQYQKPKLVVIENYTFLNTMADSTFFNKKGKFVVKNKKDVYAKRLGGVKIEQVDLIYKENKIYNLFNVFRAHENWSNLESQSRIIDKNISDRYSTDHYRSYSLKTKEQVKKITEYDVKSVISISQDQKNIIKKIIDLSKEHDFKLLFLNLPYFNELYNKIQNQVNDANTKLADMFEGNPNVKLLDLNNNKQIFSRTHFQNENGKENNHLNYKGGIIASSLIANYIKKTYNFNLKKLNSRILETYLYNEEFSGFLLKNSKIKFNLETINKTTDNVIKIAKEGKNIHLKGWALIENKRTNDNKVFLGLKKNEDFIFVVHTKSKTRNDVTKYFKKETNFYDNCGFEINFNSDLLENGDYSIYILIRNKNLGISIINTKKKIKINKK